MNEYKLRDCVRQSNGSWLCWDYVQNKFVQIEIKDVDIAKCDLCAIETLVAKIHKRSLPTGEDKAND